MRKLLLTLCSVFLYPALSEAQLFKNIQFSGLYGQWGYNLDWYSKSDLHFTNGDKYDFTVHKVTAQDRPGFKNIIENPLDITIPQNSIRGGAYLNAKHTKAIELNFDHAKYIVGNQRVHVSGTIGGEDVNFDTMFHQFMYVEHTNGANFLMLNYVNQYQLWQHKRMKATAVWKLGGGIVIPKSDVTMFGKRLDNKFHIAGYIVGAEGGFRLYPIKNLFVELTCKVGFAHYTNALTIEGGRLNHHFNFAEMIGLVGYDINFRKKAKPVKEEGLIPGEE